jgi:hypothetical protein
VEKRLEEIRAFNAASPPPPAAGKKGKVEKAPELTRSMAILAKYMQEVSDLEKMLATFGDKEERNQVLLTLLRSRQAQTAARVKDRMEEASIATLSLILSQEWFSDRPKTEFGSSTAAYERDGETYKFTVTLDTIQVKI